MSVGLTEGDVLYLLIEYQRGKGSGWIHYRGVTDDRNRAEWLLEKMKGQVPEEDKARITFEIEEVIAL